MKDNKIILFDSEEAAKPHTLQGWLSSRGLFYKDEQMARYDGCTHRNCECGNITEKLYIKCPDCRHKALVEEYNSYPLVDAKEVEFFYSLSTEAYYADLDEIYEYCGENEIEDPNELMFVACEPNYMNTFDSSYWEDIFPEDADDTILSKELVEAMKNLNKIIKAQPPISYNPGKKRVFIKF